jgi:hypothetical protein
MTTDSRLQRDAWRIDLAVAFLLTCFYYRAILFHCTDHLFDTTDQKSMLYTLEWLHHSFFGGGTIAGVFDMNVLHPHENVLAWSEAMLGAVPIYSLVRGLSGNPVLGLNVAAFVATFASCIGLARLGRLLTGRTALLAPLVGGVGLVVASQEMHFQLKAIAFVVWLTFFLCKLIMDPRPRYTAAFIALFGWLFLFCAYYAIMFLVFAVSMYGGALVLHRAPTLAWSQRMLRTFASPWVIGTIVVAASPCFWLALHYRAVQADFGDYSTSVFVPYAARITSFFDAPEVSLLWKTRHFDWGAHEARLFYGLTVYMLLVFLALTRSGDGEPKAIVRLLGCGALLACVLALGPYERYALAAGYILPLPALLYVDYFPGFGALRSIGRFGVFAVVMIAPLTELAARRLLDRVDARRSRALYAALFALVAVEQTTVQKAKPIDLDARRPFYEEVRAHTADASVILELPAASADHSGTMRLWDDQMIGSTMHWRRIPVGRSSHDSPEAWGLAEAYRAAVASPAGTPVLVEKANAIGVTQIVIDATQAAGLIDRFETELPALGYELVELNGGVLFQKQK